MSLKKAPWLLYTLFLLTIPALSAENSNIQASAETSPFVESFTIKLNSALSDAQELTQKMISLGVPENCREILLRHASNPHIAPSYITKIIETFPWKRTPATPRDKEKRTEQLLSNACLLENIIEPLTDLLDLNASMSASNHKILLLSGSHDFEKNLIAQGIASALGRPSYTINCDPNDLESSFSAGFSGSSALSDQPSMGEIANALASTGVTNPVVIIKNLDELSTAETKNLFNCINQNGPLTLRDNFLHLDINTSEITFIFLVSSQRDVPKELLKKLQNRVATINITPYRRDQKVDVTFKFLLPKLLSNYSLPQKTLLSIARFIPAIVDNSSANNGSIATINNALANVITHCAIKAQQQTSPDLTFELTPNIVEELIPTDPREEAEFLQAKHAINLQLADSPVNRFAYQTAINAFPWKKTPPQKFDKHTALKALSSKRIGLLHQARIIYETLATHAATPPIHRKTLCFVGAPGTGKTALAQTVAEALCRPEHTIDLAANPSLQGDPLIATGAQPGAFFTAFCTTKTKAAAIILDNIDKTHRLNLPALINALNPATNQQFKDQFAGFPINLSEAFFVTTATDATLIPQKLLEHLEVVYLDGYTPEEKLQIAREFFLPKALKERNIPEIAVEELHSILPTLVEYVMPYDKGLHELNRAIQSLVAKQIATILCHNKTLQLTPQNVLSMLDPLLTTHHVSTAKNVQAQCNDVIKKLKLTPEQFQLVNNHITALKPWRGGDAITLLYMSWIAKFPFNKTFTSNPPLSNALTQLHSTHFGLGSIKESILDFLAGLHMSAQNTAEKTNKTLCFVGGAGIGKTTFSESIAKALGRPFARIALESVQSLKGGAGEHEMFGDGPGPIGKAFCHTGCQNPVILLDELDKANPKVILQLLEVLDPAQNKTFRDSFLGFDLDLSNVIFIASANDMSHIPSPLVDRLHMITMEPYSLKERIDIAHAMIVPKLAASMGFDDNITQKMHDLVRPIAEKVLRTEYGVRNLKRFLQVAADKFARMLLEQKPIIALNASDILGELHAELLQTDPSKEPATEPVIGLTNGMYAMGRDGGGIAKIAASVIPFGKGQLKDSSLYGKSKKESAVWVLAYVKSVCAKYNINPEVFSNSDFLFSDQTYNKIDGPSAGIASAVALISALTKRAVRPGYAMTGALSAQGVLLPVGGYRAKILGTEQAGIKNILLPECSKDTIEQIRKDFPEINITYIKTLDEAVEILLEPAPQA